MSNNIIIRPLKPISKDTEDFRSIRLNALKFDGNAFGSSYEEEKDQALTFFENFLSTTLILGAYEADKIVGMIGFRQDMRVKFAHKGWVCSFYIAPSHRNKKLAALMLSTIIELARKKVEQLRLTVWLENKRAIALYEKCGFKSCGIEPRSLKYKGAYFDELQMVMFLDTIL